MRLVVMFDLPTETKKNKKDYTEFRRFLIRDGYDMIQFSVYSRICRDGESARQHVVKLRQWAPQVGAIRALLITNKQFAEAMIISGERKIQEKKINEAQLLLF